MRILWHSTSPICRTGYGNITRALITKLRDAGHFVRVGTKHGDKNWHDWNGFDIFEAVDTVIVNQMLQNEGFDYILTMWDIWLMYEKRPYPKKKWVAYVPVDTEWISPQLVSVAQQAGMVIAMSEHGLRELQGAGIYTHYAPLGIDTKVFRPDDSGRQDFRSHFGWGDDIFVIGSVGLNYKDDRKGFIPLMTAFKEFHKRHPNARLYIHSLANERNTVGDCVIYHELAAHLGIDSLLAWPNQSDYLLGRIDEDQLCNIYNGFDVFCLSTKGEGFGMPIIEAQACGVPVITTATTTGPELVGPGWLIDVNPMDDRAFLMHQGWRLEPRPSQILAQLEAAYAAWQGSAWGEFKAKSVENAVRFEGNAVWSKYWLPLLAEMEKRLVNP